MKRHKTSIALLTLDLVFTVCVFNAIALSRGSTDGIVLLPLLAPLGALLLALYLIEGYSARTDMISADYASLHIIAVLSALVGTLLVTFVVAPRGYELQESRAVVAISFVALAPVTLAARRAIYQRRLPGRVRRSLVFLGDRAGCELFRDECRRMGEAKRILFTLPGEAAPRPDDSGLGLRPFVSALADIRAGRLAVEAIVLREASGVLPPEIAEELVRLHFDGVPTYTLELFHERYWRKIPLYRINSIWPFQEGFQIAREPVFERIKRVSDVLLAAFGLLLAAPVMGLAAIAIKLEDGGTVFFAQTRIGRNRAPFRLFKLRTMRPSSETGDPYTRAGDARITRIGRFLRASRLDEVPQLWNVLRGDMSLIGPRAEWDRLVEEYERRIPCYNFRHLVKPGITGWAQVNYRYGANLEDTARKLEYDLYYLRHFSFVLDASIVLKTVNLMILGRGR